LRQCGGSAALWAYGGHFNEKEGDMFIPYKVDVPMQRWPIANFVLIGLTVMISFALFVPLHEWEEQRLGGMNDPAIQHWLDQQGMRVEGSNPAPSVIDSFMLQPGNFHLSQLVGNLFLHGGFWHLAGNMLFLFVFGNAVNAKLGHARYLAIYFGSGIVESLVWLVAGHGSPCMGASGAIMGIVGAFVLLYPTNDVSVGYMFTWYYSGTLEISAMWVIAMYVAFDIWGLVTGGNAGVAYLSHVIGFLTGAAAATGLLWFKVTAAEVNERSLLQVWGVMPEVDDGTKGATEAFAAHMPAKPPVAPARRPAVRKPAETGPIPLE
jgi:membrane associated rhomboid family serine protease